MNSAETNQVSTAKIDSSCQLPLLVLFGYRAAGFMAGLALLALLAVVIAALIVRRTAPPGGTGTAASGPVAFGPVAFGLPYVGLTVLALAWLRDGAGWPFVFFVFLVVWGTDVGAFFVGRTLGGPRLAPKVSPKKTWSGALGGLVFAALAAIAWSASFSAAANPLQVVGVAVVLSVFGQCGDLFESAVKRHYGVKDSGELIPGHGGMLDRIDALLAAAPVFAILHALGLTASLSQ